MTDSHNRTGKPKTVTEQLSQHGQYVISEIEVYEGVIPDFDAFDLQIRGHTSLLIADYQGTDELTNLSIEFSPAAVEDIGHELLRATHVVIPLDAITTLETVTDCAHIDTRYIENPLNYSMPFRSDPVTYPSNPAPAPPEVRGDDDDDGAIPVTPK